MSNADTFELPECGGCGEQLRDPEEVLEEREESSEESNGGEGMNLGEVCSRCRDIMKCAENPARSESCKKLQKAAEAADAR